MESSKKVALLSTWAYLRCHMIPCLAARFSETNFHVRRIFFFFFLQKLRKYYYKMNVPAARSYVSDYIM